MKNILLKKYYLDIVRGIEKYIYLINGRNPWSMGYLSYRNEIIKKNIKTDFLKYVSNNVLPKNYGFGLDERVIEYPWLLSSLPKKGRNIFDAGSILNYDFILDNNKLKGKNILISNLNPESESHNDNGVSYLYGIYGDLRKNIIRDEVFDVVVCGSVLEHVGMNNKKIYKHKSKYNKNTKDDYLLVLQEFKRILKKNGLCLITIPYGKYKNYRWFQVFDYKMVKKVIGVFGEDNTEVDIFKYSEEGWKLSNLYESKNAQYFEVHKERHYFSNKLAAAGAVACIKMIKR